MVEVTKYTMAEVEKEEMEMDRELFQMVAVDSSIEATKKSAAYCTEEQWKSMQDLMAAMKAQRAAATPVPNEAAAAAVNVPTSSSTPTSSTGNSGGMSFAFGGDTKVDMGGLSRSPSAKRAGEATDQDKPAKLKGAQCTAWQKELEGESGKRRDLKDTVPDMEESIYDVKQELDKYRYATTGLAEALVKENDAASGTQVVLVKRRCCLFGTCLERGTVSKIPMEQRCKWLRCTQQAPSGQSNASVSSSGVQFSTPS